MTAHPDLTKREWFAAHMLESAPEWFIHDERYTPPHIPWPAIISEETRKKILRSRFFPFDAEDFAKDDDEKLAIHNFIEEAARVVEEDKRERARKEINRRAAWCYAYADAMLAESAKGGPDA